MHDKHAYESQHTNTIINPKMRTCTHEHARTCAYAAARTVAPSISVRSRTNVHLPCSFDRLLNRHKRRYTPLVSLIPSLSDPSPCHSHRTRTGTRTDKNTKYEQNTNMNEHEQEHKSMTLSLTRS